jgi:hypothetical protein
LCRAEISVRQIAECLFCWYSPAINQKFFPMLSPIPLAVFPISLASLLKVAALAALRASLSANDVSGIWSALPLKHDTKSS